MSSSEETYQQAMAEFRSVGPSSLSKRIVQVAYLRAREGGVPAWSWLEETIARFRRGIDTSHGSFAASASFARAIAHHGVVGERPLRDCLAELHSDDPKFTHAVEAEIGKVDRAKASRTRRASGGRAEGSRWGDTYPVFRTVQTLIELAGRGDEKAREELVMIRDAISS